jgi:hypothetical protein
VGYAWSAGGAGGRKGTSVIDGKEQIEKYGVEPFHQDAASESVWTYKGMWEDFSGMLSVFGRIWSIHM